MSSYPNLFSPIKIGSLEIKNRGVMPPMVTNFGESDGKVTQRIIDYYGARADGGVGLIIHEALCISPEGRGFTNMINIDADDTIPGLKKLVDRVHEGGACIAAQLIHCGRQANIAVTGMESVAPSAIPCPVMQAVPHELTVEEIKEVVGKYADAALRAKKAGFDVVEIHGAHGYLICQFLSPFSNHRTDEYGGSLENRGRFPLEVLAAVREKVGADYPVIYRITSEEFLPGSLHLDETAAFSKVLVDNGIDGIHVSGGNYASGHSVSGADDKMGYYADNAAAIRKAVNAKVPIIVANRIRTPELGEEIISDGKADMIAYGRTLICDPEFFNKACSGKANEIRKCTSCLYCISLLMGGVSIACLYNPLVGQEGNFDMTKKAAKSKKLAVIGGGPAGMAAAYIAANRGHDVVLFEKATELGGNVTPGTKPPFKSEIGFVTDYLTRMVKVAGVDVRLNIKAGLDEVKKLSPDAVFVASGAVPVIPEIPGADGPNVVTAEDILNGAAQAGKTVVVIGGGSVGVETAEYLAEKGCKVTVIEMLEELMADITPSMKGATLGRAQDMLSLKLSEKVKEIKQGGVVTDKAVYDNVDTVVLAVGYKAMDELSGALKQAGFDACVIGDASSPRRISDAVQEGFIAAYEL